LRHELLCNRVSVADHRRGDTDVRRAIASNSWKATSDELEQSFESIEVLICAEQRYGLGQGKGERAIGLSGCSCSERMRSQDENGHLREDVLTRRLLVTAQLLIFRECFRRRQRQDWASHREHLAIP
jgi:hypothetical protein